MLLINDPEDKTIFDFGLSIHSGGWDDPIERPGLSNLMQHLIVEGMPVDDCESLFDCMQK